MVSISSIDYSWVRMSNVFKSSTLVSRVKSRISVGVQEVKDVESSWEVTYQPSNASIVKRHSSPGGLVAREGSYKRRNHEKAGWIYIAHRLHIVCASFARRNLVWSVLILSGGLYK